MELKSKSIKSCYISLHRYMSLGNLICLVFGVFFRVGTSGARKKPKRPGNNVKYSFNGALKNIFTTYLPTSICVKVFFVADSTTRYLPLHTMHNQIIRCLYTKYENKCTIIKHNCCS